MNTDLRQMLDQLAGPADVDDSTVQDDLLRARAARRRRRHRRAAGGLGVAAVAGAAVMSAGNLGGIDARTVPLVRSEPPSATLPGTTPPSAPEVQAVQLVSFTGQPPPGYEIAYVPDGWEIQGATPHFLVVAPIGFADQEPMSFLGKLVVMLRSADDTGTPAGEPVPVGDSTGYLNEEVGIAQTLTYTDARGTWVQVQVPPSLGWSAQEIARFGEGVVVTGSAQETRG